MLLKTTLKPFVVFHVRSRRIIRAGYCHAADLALQKHPGGKATFVDVDELPKPRTHRMEFKNRKWVVIAGGTETVRRREGRKKATDGQQKIARRKANLFSAAAEDDLAIDAGLRAIISLNPPEPHKTELVDILAARTDLD